VNKPNGQKQQHMPSTTKQKGDAAEDRALHYLQAQGLHLLHRNYRTPGRGGGEIDLVMKDTENTLVFVEVRHRASAQHGGALGSVSRAKQRRIIFAAKYFLLKLSNTPACRFDVVAVDGVGMQWLKAAFDAD
jgi:putative endonuclease